MQRVIPLILLSLLLATEQLFAITFLVKADGTGDFPTIQLAVDACGDGDVILLADGIYTGIGNWDIDFGGRSITLRSESGRPLNCAIHCLAGDAGYHRGFYFHRGERNEAVIEDITIEGGFIREGSGAGILIENNSSPIIRNCVIKDCAFEGSGLLEGGLTLGGGIGIRDSNPLILHNLIMQNDVTPTLATDHIAGGGIYIVGGSPVICGNHILHNNSYGDGAGICSEHSAPEITCNTIEGNRTRRDGGGIYVLGKYFDEEAKIHNNLIINNIGGNGGGIRWSDASPSVSNNTIAGNDYEGISGSGGAVTNCIIYNNARGVSWHSPDITFSWVEGGYPGTGNIAGTSITFLAGPAGRYYLPDDHECVDAGSDPASSLCISYGTGTVCMDRLTVRKDQRYDTGQVDIGYHYVRVPSTYGVPGAFATIQEAIDFAINGDVIIVEAGFYSENIDFRGKRIRVEGSAGYLKSTIRGDGTGPVVTFAGGETANTILSRFVITGGNAGHGGGIYIRDSSPRIEFCEVEDNYAALGGGIYCHNSAADFMTVDINGNEAELGGGMYLSHSGTRINSCTISDNVAYGNGSGIRGGGIYIDASIPRITYTVFARNHAFINYGESRGGGIYCCDAALEPAIANCTFYRNMADVGSAIEIESCSAAVARTIFAHNGVGRSIHCSGNGSVSLASCDLYHYDGIEWTGCIAGQDTVGNNISADPVFCDVGNEDFHISSLSPCAPDNSFGAALIGARTVQCYPATHEVLADGGGSFATIQDAVDHALGGQTIALGDGTYTGTGNRDIDFKRKSLTVRSKNGDPDSCIIDCEGSEDDPHQGFVLMGHEGARIEGVTIANAHASTTKPGGGIQIFRSSPVIENCVIKDCSAYHGGGLSTLECYAVIASCRFIGNTAQARGGAIVNLTGHPAIDNCTFIGNRAEEGGAINNHPGSPAITGCTFAKNAAGTRGGGMFSELESSNPTIAGCTFVQNAAPYGGGVYSRASAATEMHNSIIAFSTEGGAVHCESEATISLYCCDIYGNAGGDYIGCVAGQENESGNFSRDPLFCDTLAMNYQLHENSPCAIGYSGRCGLIGARGTACEAFIPPPPTAMRLYQCYPNPFNAAALIAFDISEPCAVRLRIYDVAGHLVHTLVDKKYEPGRYEEIWDGRGGNGSEVASGVYFYRLTAGPFTETRKMILLR